MLQSSWLQCLSPKKFHFKYLLKTTIKNLPSKLWHTGDYWSLPSRCDMLTIPCHAFMMNFTKLLLLNVPSPVMLGAAQLYAVGEGAWNMRCLMWHSDPPSHPLCVRLDCETKVRMLDVHTKHTMEGTFRWGTTWR